MARVASRRQLPKPRKMMGPVGESFGVEGVPEGVRYDACRGCGYHVCSCKPVDPYALYHQSREMYPDIPIIAWNYLRKGSHVLLDGAIRMSPQDIPPEHRDQRPGSVDVAGLEKLRAERFTEYHLRKAAEREF